MKNLLIASIIIVLTSCGIMQKSNKGSVANVDYRSHNKGRASCVSGEFVNEFGEPMVSVKVALLNPNNKIVDGALTDIEGKYSICIDEPGQYSLRIEHIGMKSQRIEVELKMGEMLVFNDKLIMEEEKIYLEKPLIYLYPKNDVNVELSVELESGLTHSYPKYSEGWKVKAMPDGTLLDSNGRSYYGLYWEAEIPEPANIKTSNIIAREELIPFLEESLDKLGLTEREANEFIIYWLPRLSEKAFAQIHFSTREYAQKVPLKVSPKPDQEIRVMMYFKLLDEEIELAPQKIEKIERLKNAFVLVEWGGCELKK